MALKKGTKLHLLEQDGFGIGKVGNKEVVESVCGRLVEASMALPRVLWEQWAESRVSTDPICGNCMGRIDVVWVGEPVKASRRVVAV